MEQLNGTFLFDSMYAEDVEGSKLSHLPGVGELLGAYPSRSRPPVQGESPTPLGPRAVHPGQRGPGQNTWGVWSAGPRLPGMQPSCSRVLLCALHPVFTTVSPPAGWVLSQTPACSWGSQACRGGRVAWLGAAGWA